MRTEDPDLWNKREEAERVMTAPKQTKYRPEPWEELRVQIVDLEELHGVAGENGDGGLEGEIESTLAALRKRFAGL